MKKARPKKKTGHKIKINSRRLSTVPIQIGNITCPPTGPGNSNKAESISASGGTGGTVVGA